MRSLIKLSVIAAILLSASSVFAGATYDLSIDTGALSGTGGYLYFQYATTSSVSSTATVSNFFTNGVLNSTSSRNFLVDSVTNHGTLPGDLVFHNTLGVTDYNHGIQFGNTINFSLALANAVNDATTGTGTSTLSLNFYADEAGTTQLGETLFMADINASGVSSLTTASSGVTVTPTPIPAAIWLMGSGLLGLIGIGRRKSGSAALAS